MEYIFSINKSNENDLVNYINKCQNLFSPALNEIIDLNEFTNKILYKCDKFECWSNNVLIALVSAYINDKNSHVAFINHVCVLKDFEKKGIAKKLLHNCFIECQKRNFLEIQLNVMENNYKAISLYQNLGFEKLSFASPYYKMQKRLSKQV